MAEQDITVIDNSYTVTSIEDNYSIHVLDGLGIPGQDGEQGPPGNLTNPVDYIRWITEPVAAPDTEGTGSWDSATHLLKLRSDIPGSFLNVGLENWVRVRNKTGVVIPNGRFVTGVASDKPKVFDVVLSRPVPGQAAISGLTTSTLQIYDEGVEHGEGWAATFGHAGGVDTTDLGAFKTVYISDDPLKPGEPTLIPPSPPNYAIPMGFSVDKQLDGNLFIFAVNPVSIIAATDAAVASGDPTGFHDNDNIEQHYDPVTRKITQSHPSGVLRYTWRNQIKELASPWVSPAHPDVLDKGYFLYSLDGENFVWSEAPWDFDDIQVAFAWYGTIDKFGIREPHGLMPHQSHKQEHQTTGTYRESGGDVSGYVLGSTVPAERRPTVSSANVKDEDNITVNPSLVDSLYARGYLTGAGVFTFAKASADINLNAGNQPQYNFFDGVDWIQDLVPQNQRMSIWVAEVPVTADDGSQSYRLLWVQGQSYGTLTDQRNETTEGLALGNFQTLFTEFVFIEQIIIRYQGGDWFWEESIRLTGTRNQQVGSPAGNYLSSVAVDGVTITGDGTPTNPLVGVGGGGEFEVIESRSMTGNAIELFTVGTDDVVKIVMDGIRYGGDGDSFPNISCSIDGGATYPSTHTWSSIENTSGVVPPHGQAVTNSASIWLYDGASQRDTADASIIFNGVTDAGGPTIAKEFTYAGHDIGSEVGSCRGAGVFGTVGVVNKIKIASQAGNTMTAGAITLLKRTY